MSVKNPELLEKIKLFSEFLSMSKVMYNLRYLGTFTEFKEIYAVERTKHKDENSSDIVARVLHHGIEENLISKENLDELLFQLIEDSLMNAFLYRLSSSAPADAEAVKNSLSLPTEITIIDNVYSDSNKDFIVCGYRIVKNINKVENVRILMIDKKPVDIFRKNESNTKVVFPTIVELDYRHQLLHVRTREVDNILNTEGKISKMSERIENTLNFIISLNTSVSYRELSSFKTSLFLLEENLLKDKRKLAYQKVDELSSEIKDFTDVITKKINPPTTEIMPEDYIRSGVLSIAATTLSDNTVGEVIGIKFRNNNEQREYAEVTIKDTGNRCISTSNLYWINLSVLLNVEKVEYLKIVPYLESGSSIVNLEFALDTANIKLLKRRDENGDTPNQHKYDDVIEFIIPFINASNKL